MKKKSFREKCEKQLKEFGQQTEQLREIHMKILQAVYEDNIDLSYLYKAGDGEVFKQVKEVFDAFPNVEQQKLDIKYKQSKYAAALNF